MGKSAESNLAPVPLTVNPAQYGSADLGSSQNVDMGLSTTTSTHDTAQYFIDDMSCDAYHAMPDQALSHLDSQTELCMTYGISPSRSIPYRIDTSVRLQEELSYQTDANSYMSNPVLWSGASDNSSPLSSLLQTPEDNVSDLKVLPLLLHRSAANESTSG